MTLPKFAILTSLALLTIAAFGQQEGALPTQILVHADSKADIALTADSIKLEVDRKVTPLVSLAPVKPATVQIALLIDDGLSRGSGIQLDDIKGFIDTVPPGAELLLGYMTNGTVQVATPFSTDHSAAAAALHVPMGVPGQSASPYFCLSDFVKKWPGAESGGGSPKSRFVIMITNGVDPYNGSTSIMNQDSPYVAAAVADAQRAGVAIYSIYYRDSGFRGGSASFSGQGYLQQIGDATGGFNYYEGSGSPISLTPFFKQFLHAISETYVATFMTNGQGGGRDHLVQVKMSTSTPKLKLRHADEVRPGNLEASPQIAAMQQQMQQ